MREAALLYRSSQNSLAEVLDAATEDLEEIVVTRAGRESAVVVSLREYEALKETAYLLGNPANARHLQRGLEEFAADGFRLGECPNVLYDGVRVKSFGGVFRLLRRRGGLRGPLRLRWR
ncbi:type II toxin-antitoxin system Phd/YefM family antitoxin [Nocardia macrotermitis]|uniref:type II toxin-antitoxin system Phd/YefM family antitoxin n=1 Tax=Nocardia macrotermitis TaxID=2585198 RepID=UPI0029E7F668|nr:type II toxin-antitoxin system prevent-host-death family antitoxin [Nocardia macrotermitis]